jgi:hypothetical protein
MGRSNQKRIVEIDRGLFLVRYASAEDEKQPPKVSIAPDAGSDDKISFILHPDCHEAVLWEPSSCLVVRVTSPGRLAVEVVPQTQSGTAAASVQIEPLTQGIGPLTQGQHPSVSAKRRGDSSLPDDLEGFRILGHVAGIGDVIVNAGEWLAGPIAPSRIEGVSIEWPNKPNDVDVHYSVKTAKAQTISGQTTGTFAGTRGKALPIVGVTLEMSGFGAENYHFDVEAIFLGSPAVRHSGTRIVLTGPTGREPLVGLRVALVRAGPVERVSSAAAGSRPGNAATRVRVFRSRQRQDQSAAR